MDSKELILASVEQARLEAEFTARLRNSTDVNGVLSAGLFAAWNPDIDQTLEQYLESTRSAIAEGHERLNSMVYEYLDESPDSESENEADLYVVSVADVDAYLEEQMAGPPTGVARDLFLTLVRRHVGRCDLFGEALTACLEAAFEEYMSAPLA